MLKLRCNGFQGFSLLHIFRRVLLLSTSSPSSSPENTTTNNFSNYLVSFLGFSDQQSLSTSSKLIQFWKGRVPTKLSTFDFQINTDSVVTFLKQNGLDQSQIRHVVTQDPRILFVNVDKTLKPKINDLRELGISGSDLARVISKNPGLLIRPLSPAVKAVREVFGSDVDVAKVLKRSAWNWSPSPLKFLVPNVTLLQSYGVPTDRIRRAVLRQPSALLRNTKLFRDVLNRVEEKWGVTPGSGAFIYAVQLLSNFSEETIDSKCRLLKSFGWRESDIVALVRVNPMCLAFSEARITNSLEFLMNELGYEPAYLTSTSFLLKYSVEKRLVPRHRVLQILKDKGLIRTDYKLCSASVLSESVFLKKFIQPFKEVVPHLHELYTNCQLNSSCVSQKQGKELSAVSSL